MSKIHWILQSNLIKEDIYNQIKMALDKDMISYEEVKIIPFSDEFPKIEKSGEVNVFYGSTTLILNAYKQLGKTKGIFYDSENFNLKTYLEKWAHHILNSDSKILTFSEILSLQLEENSKWFLRPIEDDKSFSGRIMSLEEIRQFESELAVSNNPYLTPETLVGISLPKIIEKEWRLFIVNKKIISGCRYILYGEVNVDNEDLPISMITFAENCCEIFTPSDVFVMDIALENESYKIVECNCFNDSGFYKNDISLIIHEVNQFLTNKQN